MYWPRYWENYLKHKWPSIVLPCPTQHCLSLQLHPPPYPTTTTTIPVRAPREGKVLCCVFCGHPAAGLPTNWTDFLTGSQNEETDLSDSCSGLPKRSRCIGKMFIQSVNWPLVNSLVNLIGKGWNYIRDLHWKSVMFWQNRIFASKALCSRAVS